MEQPVVGALLAAAAGALNAWSFSHSGTFATVQSGNVIVAGAALAGGDLARVWMAVLSVGCFGLGAFANSLVVTFLIRRGRSYSGPVLFTQAAVIAAVAALSFAGVSPAAGLILAISFVAGSQGTRSTAIMECSTATSR